MSTPEVNPSADAIFRRGFSHHARGEHVIASAFYEWLMEVAPDDARSWHWYGVAKLEQGDAQAALNFISKAITLDASDATAFLNLGNCMQALNLHEQAVQVFEAALALREDYAQAALNMGNSFRSLKRYRQAQHAYELAISLRADYSSAHFNLGNLHAEMGDTDAALAAFDAAIRLNADVSDVWCNRGNLLKQVERFADALASYDEAIRLKPGDATVWSNRGLTRHELGDYENAIADYDQALLLRPAYVNALCNKGNSLRSLKRSDEAMQCYDDALQLEADNAQAHCNRGLLFRQLYETRKAMDCFDEAIRCNPSLAQAYSNRALMHKAVGDYEASMADQLKALEIDPLMADAHTNMGALYHDLNRIDEAIACHRKAIDISPNHPQANWNLSLDLILNGQMDEGWKLYEWRLHKLGKGMSHLHHGKPRWAPGQNIAGLTILLTHEQGFGDTLQFCRFALLLKQAGAHVWMEVPKTLHALLQSLDADIRLFDEDACSEPFDVWCPLLSLPMALSMQMDDIPTWQHYLGVDAGKAAEWEQRLHDSSVSQQATVVRGASHPHAGDGQAPAGWLLALTDTARDSGRRMRIGLCATGNPNHENTLNRDMPLNSLLQALPDCHDYVMLQKRISESEQVELDATALALTQWSGDLHDFSDTAALCSRMDLIISVDTSVAHLAAAIGCPTWILLPWVPDWRWMRERSDSPWYPTVRLFRQEALQDWSAPLQTVSEALESICP